MFTVQLPLIQSIAKNAPNVGTDTHEICIGLVLQFHFVGLDEHEPLELPTYNQSALV